jgi:hypothetical protein
MQLHDEPHWTLGLPEPAQVAVHASGPQAKLAPEQALIDEPQESAQVPFMHVTAAPLQTFTPLWQRTAQP